MIERKKQELDNVRSFQEKARESANIYKLITGKRVPPRPEIFLKAYIQEIADSMAHGPIQDKLNQMIMEADETGNVDSLRTLAYEGTMPDGLKYTDHAPLIEIPIEWDLKENFYLTDYFGCHQEELQNQVDQAVVNAINGNTSDLDALIAGPNDIRCVVHRLNDLWEAGLCETTNEIFNRLGSSGALIRNCFSQDHMQEFKAWLETQAQNRQEPTL